MPIQDWTKVPDLFLHFRHMWLCELCDALNGAFSTTQYMALIELRPNARLQDSPLKDGEVYAGRPNRVAVHAGYGNTVAAIEIVTAGNKIDDRSLRALCDSIVESVRSGIPVLVIDLFPPSPSNPRGIHPIIWKSLRPECSVEMPANHSLTLASYRSGSAVEAYIEPVAFGNVLPQMPIFLQRETPFPAPLEETYLRAWDHCPDAMKTMVLNPMAL